ncbi:unnamed protein product [Durusdinium trenchii]|uniref:Uncharacterized protein n=2 Tax=Durusdinium trenchii TaxID=1381693 RepID=A0ABP0SIB1_9DINO
MLVADAVPAGATSGATRPGRCAVATRELHGLALPRLLEHLAPDEAAGRSSFSSESSSWAARATTAAIFQALSIAWALALRFSGSGHLPQLLQMAQTTELAPTKATQVQQIVLSLESAPDMGRGGKSTGCRCGARST